MSHTNHSLQKCHWLLDVSCTDTISTEPERDTGVWSLMLPAITATSSFPATQVWNCYLVWKLLSVFVSPYFASCPPFVWSGICNFSVIPEEQFPRAWCWTCSGGHKLGTTPLLVVTQKHTSLDSGFSYLLHSRGLKVKWSASTLLEKKQNKTKPIPKPTKTRPQQIEAHQKCVRIVMVRKFLLQT